MNINSKSNQILEKKLIKKRPKKIQSKEKKLKDGFKKKYLRLLL
jgi:hypothetical protein